MEKRKLSLNLSKLLENKLFVKILAIAIAIILWFTLSISVYPNVEKRISGIPITVSAGVAASADNTLSAQNLENMTVTANISGARYVIGDYTSDNLIASVDASGITKAGEYTLDVNVSSANGETIEVLSVSPKSVTVSFDFTATKVIELTADKVDTSSLVTSDGFVKDIPEINPKSISIEGPKTLVDSISTASIKVLDNAKDLSEPFATSNTEVKLFDESGKEISKDRLTVTPESISVSVNVTKQDSAPITVTFMNSQGNDASDIFDADSIISSISPQAINVSATGNADKDISLDLSLNLREVKPGETVSIKSNAIKAALSAKGLSESDGGVSSIYVSYKSDGISEKTVNIPKSAIKLANIPGTKNVTIATEEITGVTVYGPTEILDKLDDSSFVAYLDLSKAELSNDTFPVTIYCPDEKSVWAYGDQKITLKITDKES